MKIIKLYLFTAAVMISIQGNAQESKTKTDSNQNKSNAEEKNFAGRTARETMLVLYGITNYDQFKSLQAAMEKTKGINTVTTPAFTPGQTALKLNTFLTTDELIESVKKWNPKSYYQVVMAMNEMISMVMTNKPVDQNKTKNTEPAADQQADKNLSPANPGTPNNHQQPSEVADEDKTYTKLMDEASFPGGNTAWSEYVRKNLNTDIPKTKGAPPGTYTVVVQFIVDKDGSISDVEALNHPGYGMENEAVRLIQKGPKWKPGSNTNFGSEGHAVKSYKKQPVKFVVTN